MRHLRLGAGTHDARGERAESHLGAEDTREDRQDSRLLDHVLEHAALVHQVPDVIGRVEHVQRVVLLDRGRLGRGELEDALPRLGHGALVEQPLEDDEAPAMGYLADDLIDIP